MLESKYWHNKTEIKDVKVAVMVEFRGRFRGFEKGGRSMSVTMVGQRGEF